MKEKTLVHFKIKNLIIVKERWPGLVEAENFLF